MKFIKTNWKMISLVLMTALFIISIINGCGNKSQGNDFEDEAKKYKALYESCDTAMIDIQIIKSELEAKLKSVDLPNPLIVEPTSSVISQLRSQVQRNKSKQVKLIGDCKEDSIQFAAGIKQRDLDILNLISSEAEYVIDINNYIREIDKLKNDLKKRIYIDSVEHVNYTARYEATTNGTLEDFRLAVDVNPVLVTKTIQLPAPPAQQFSHRHRISLIYTPFMTWDSKYNVSQKAGIEYQIGEGWLKSRLNANYLIETKDYEGSATVVINPFKWGKKTKK